MYDAQGRNDHETEWNEVDREIEGLEGRLLHPLEWYEKQRQSDWTEVGHVEKCV